MGQVMHERGADGGATGHPGFDGCPGCCRRGGGRRWWACISVSVFSAVFVLPCARAENEGNVEAIRRFGVERSDPINQGFLFHRGAYIEAPYVVARRGLDVYVNHVLVRRGAEWPPYDYRVNEDPGAPPPDVSPFDPVPKGTDPRDTYWSRKWRYLSGHYKHATAVTMMTEAYRKCSKFREVVQDAERPDVLIVTTESGRKQRISHWVAPGETQKPPDEGQLLKSAKEGKFYYEQLLKAGTAISSVHSGEMIVPKRQVPQFLETLLATQDKTLRKEQLEAARLLRPGDKVFGVIAADFKASGQLAERLEALKKAEAARRLANALKREARIAMDQVRVDDPIKDPAFLDPEPYEAGRSEIQDATHAGQVETVRTPKATNRQFERPAWIVALWTAGGLLVLVGVGLGVRATIRRFAARRGPAC